MEKCKLERLRIRIKLDEHTQMPKTAQPQEVQTKTNAMSEVKTATGRIGALAQ